jgi:2-polyprenyl-3-methyl-5-hydroxy-6-metoxy-1,4-benzoquinol methylase
MNYYKTKVNSENFREKKYMRDYMYYYRAENKKIFDCCKENNGLKERSCPLCGSKESVLYIRNLIGCQYRLCISCDFVFLSPILNDEALAKIYFESEKSIKRNYYENLMYNLKKEKKPQDSIYPIDFLKRYKKEGSLLDFGCSIGIFLNKAKYFYDVTGIDIDPYMSSLGRENLGLNIINCNILDKNLNFKNKYDIITMRQVIEHLQDPYKIILKLSTFLKDNGIIFIECPNYKSYSLRIIGKYHSMIEGNEHINMFSMNSIERLLVKLGFEIKILETYSWDIELYDLIGLCMSTIHPFYHRFSYRNPITMRLFELPNLLFLKWINYFQGENRDAGSYIRVLARLK